METLIPEGIRQLASQGTGWLLFLFAAAACVWLFRRLLTTLQERITEATTVALALRESAEATAELAQAVKDRTSAFDALSVLVSQQVKDYATNNQNWEKTGARWERMLEDIRNAQTGKAG